MSERKPQRVVFGEALVELGAEDRRLVVLDADVSSSTQTRLFAQAFPDRFFNFGIAEANMVSAAAGMATTGLIPVVSTFALFIALRASEQVRAQAAFTGLSVKLVGGYAGLSDYADGASHQSVEDIAVMRAIPNMTVVAPSDAVEMRLALRAAIARPGPVFLRVSREAVGEEFNPATHPFHIGKGIPLRTGRDVTLFATGTMVPMALAAAEQLQAGGVSAAVIDMHTLKPLDEELVAQAARETGAIVTIEEHSIIGGLGSAVCEAVCGRWPAPVVRCGIPDKFGESGAYEEILARAGLSVPAIVAAAGRAVKMKSGKQ
jgi:transketolase